LTRDPIRSTGTLSNLSALRIVCASAAALSLSAAAIAGVVGVGALAAGSAGLAMNRWQDAGRITSSDAWTDSYTRMRLALRLDPFSADHSADLGHLYAWQAWQQSLGSSETRKYRLEALKQYRKAVTKRPTWGFGWAHVAQQHLLLGAMEVSGLDAIEKAVRVSPWEARVQHKILWIGFALWDELPEKTRATVRRTLERAVRIDNDIAGLIRLAHDHGRVDMIVPMLRTPEHRALFEYLNAKFESR
jgi:hypothetical protein